MIQTVNATQVKNNFGEWIKRVYQDHVQLVVEKSGIPVVAIVPLADYQQMLAKRGPTAPGLKEKIETASLLSETGQELKESLKETSAKPTPPSRTENA